MPLTQVQNGMLAGVIPASLGGTAGTAGVTGFKNRIINGGMVIDQRNAGASVNNLAGALTYSVDRWPVNCSAASKFSMQQNAGSVTPPAGFSNYLGLTSLSAYSSGSTDYFHLYQPIEGYNIADLNWGTANAKTVTASFWVRASVTGTYGGIIINSAATANYPFTYTVNSANTWEQKTLTIVGPTIGAWNSTNGTGLEFRFDLGSGSAYTTGTAGAWSASFGYPSGTVKFVATNGGTLYITGVQLEVGSAATTFDYRPYGTELQLCQRYLPVWYGGGDQIIVMYNSSTGILGSFKTPVPVRSVVTGLTFSTNANSIFSAYDGFKGGYTPTNAALNNGGINYVTIQCNSTSLGTGQAGLLRVADSQWMYGTGCEL
jgi:hypothetical protein